MAWINLGGSSLEMAVLEIRLSKSRCVSSENCCTSIPTHVWRGMTGKAVMSVESIHPSASGRTSIRPDGIRLRGQGPNRSCPPRGVDARIGARSGGRLPGGSPMARVVGAGRDRLFPKGSRSAATRSFERCSVRPKRPSPASLRVDSDCNAHSFARKPVMPNHRRSMNGKHRKQGRSVLSKRSSPPWPLELSMRCGQGSVT